DEVLEVIYRRGVGQNQQPRLQMFQAITLRIGAEEALELRPREELQRHRMDLTRLVRRPQVIRDADVPAGIVLERVSQLVKKNVHVVRRSVEVCEDVRQSVGGKRRAESAPGFPVARLQIQKLAIDHHAGE